MQAWSTVEVILDHLDKANLVPSYTTLPRRTLNWSAMPSAVDPSAGGLSGDRARRKRWQIASLIAALEIVVEPGQVIVDFGASSGHLGLPVAAQFPDNQVYLVDKKPHTAAIAQRRLQNSGLENVTIYPGLASDFEPRFDIGMGLHLCGDATDRVQTICLENEAAYVIVPCCHGSIKKSDLTFPRSKAYREIVDRAELEKVAKVADWTSRDRGGWRHRCGQRCMGLVNEDRNRRARESGYHTQHCVMSPAHATPKNEILIGIPKSFREYRSHKNVRIS